MYLANEAQQKCICFSFNFEILFFFVFCFNLFSNFDFFAEVSPYLDLVLCPIREQPWSCARQQSARLLDVWDNELHSQWQKLKGKFQIYLIF